MFGAALISDAQFCPVVKAGSSPAVPLSPLRGIYRDIAFTSAVLDANGIDAVGLTLELDLPEMGASGTAVITDMRTYPTVETGTGQVVTATFSHPPSNLVLYVQFEGETKPIGVTDNHLFWSVDRLEFLPIGQMDLGERVQTFHGDTKRIEQKLPRPGPQVVYNLEVYGEHVYFVGEQGVLAHNMYGGANRSISPITQFDIHTYGKFSDNVRYPKVQADRIQGHELLGNNWLKHHLGVRRGKGLSRQNPALALKTNGPDSLHTLVNTLQGEAGHFSKNIILNQSWRANVLENIQFLKEVGVPRDVITDLARQTRKFAISNGL